MLLVGFYPNLLLINFGPGSAHLLPLTTPLTFSEAFIFWCNSVHASLVSANHPLSN